MTILQSERIDHGFCLIDVFRAPQDLYESWDIVHPNEDGTYSRLPDAGYGVDANDRDVSQINFKPVHVIESYVRWDENGWTKSETTIRSNGRIVASKKD